MLKYLNWNYLYSSFPEEFTEKTGFHRHEQRPQSVWHKRVEKKKKSLPFGVTMCEQCVNTTV